MQRNCQGAVKELQGRCRGAQRTLLQFEHVHHARSCKRSNRPGSLALASPAHRAQAPRRVSHGGQLPRYADANPAPRRADPGSASA